jgi:hypothetical protein
MSGFKIAGFSLLVLFAVWIGISLTKYPLARPAPPTFQASSGFEGTTLLSSSETQPHLDHARARMLAINSHGQTFSVVDNIATWASFLATAAVTLILGFLGRRVTAAGEPAEVSGLPNTLARTIGVLAALAAVLTAGGAMARNQARDDYQKADSARDHINAAISDLAGSKTTQEARDAMDKLDLEIGRL